MKSVIYRKDGVQELVEDGFPCFTEGEPPTIYFHNAQMEIITDDVPVAVIEKIEIDLRD